MEKWETTKKQLLTLIKLNFSEFEDAKKSFSESFDQNPIYATEWKLERVVKAQVVAEIWHPIKEMLEASESREWFTDKVSKYVANFIERFINSSHRINTSSSQITNTKESWKLEQTFECIKKDFGSGISNLPGLIKFLNKKEQ